MRHFPTLQAGGSELGLGSAGCMWACAAAEGHHLLFALSPYGASVTVAAFGS